MFYVDMNINQSIDQSTRTHGQLWPVALTTDTTRNGDQTALGRFILFSISSDRFANFAVCKLTIAGSWYSMARCDDCFAARRSDRF